MALKALIRGWLAVPSETALNDALTALRGENARLAGEVERLAGDGAQLAGEGARLAGELATSRSHDEEQHALRRQEIDALRNDLSALAERFDAHAGRAYAATDDLTAVHDRIDGGDARIEEIRRSLAALAEQSRWESEDLRKLLAAIVERVERQRKAA